jgi:hypothetical protein
MVAMPAKMSLNGLTKIFGGWKATGSGGYGFAIVVVALDKERVTIGLSSAGNRTRKQGVGIEYYVMSCGDPFREGAPTGE